MHLFIHLFIHLFYKFILFISHRQINDKNEEVIDIIDSFGRCKTILIRSKEYQLHIENLEIEKTKRKFHEKNGGDSKTINKNLESSSRSDNNSNNYAWSNGQNHNESGEWLRDSVTEKGLRALVDQKVEKEIELSNGAKVKTMYEKTLSSSAKSFLKEVHEDSIMQRTLHLEKASGVTTSRLDDRRELLRLKKLRQLDK